MRSKGSPFPVLTTSETSTSRPRCCRLDPPIELVGHDIGALLTLRLASIIDIPLRSWVVDVANVFHPNFVWPDRVQSLQTPGVGEEVLQTAREADAGDPRSTTARLVAGGVPDDLAAEIAAAHDETMSQSILDFYRSAVPDIAADWWSDTGPTRARGPFFYFLILQKTKRCHSRSPHGLGLRPHASRISTTAG